MKVNPAKFQFMIMYSGNNPDPIELTIRNESIKSLECVKLLGVFIDNRLNFDKHISTLCQKASRQCYALQRIAKFLGKESKECLYNSFILSNFMYANLAWHFCSKKNTIKIEKINKKALRIVMNDFSLSYVESLSSLKRCSLYLLRMKSMANEMYKCLNNISPEFLKNLFAVSEYPYELRGGKSLVQPVVDSTTFGLKSFRYEGAKLWNCLPSQIKSATSFCEFKTLMKQWTGPTCQCRSCVLCDIGCL